MEIVEHSFRISSPRAIMVIGGLILSLGFCYGLAPAGVSPDDAAAVVNGNNRFALELYARLRTQEGNLFFSPGSISTALAMTYAGARGKTEAEMAKALHFNLPQSQLHPAFAALIKSLKASDKERGYQLNIANRLWGEKGYAFLDSFLKITRDYYGAELAAVDFTGAAEAARQTINAWVEKETRGKIKDLIGKGILDSLTRLVLTNAVYFKGDWARQFKEEETKEAPFIVAADKRVTVPLMTREGEFKYMEEETFQALEIPYVNEELSLVVFLPRKAEGLKEFEESFTFENLKRWLAALQKREVKVFLPKFKLNSKFNLGNVLAAMGMPLAFTPAADFSGMTGVKDLFISAVLHQAFIDLNEEGTEAAAATAVIMKLTAMPSRPTVFRADRPFLFLIRDNRTGSILFLGRLEDPQT